MTDARVMQRTALVLVVLMLAATVASAAPVDVPAGERAQWLRWTLPLPKQIAIPRKVVLAPADVGIFVERGAGPATLTAAEQLRALFAERAGAEPTGAAFGIRLGVCDEDGQVGGRPTVDRARLEALPNAEQAYAIVPRGDDGLVLTGLDDRGVFYAAQTLRQLLEATLTADSVAIPLAGVLDWPDLEERGEWGGSCVRDIEWAAAYKMNLVEAHSEETVADDGTAIATYDPEVALRGLNHATNVVPIITHLDHLIGTRIYDVFPQLVGEGYDLSAPQSGSLIAPCASKPEFTAVLAGWMDGLASIEGITDINCWLSEIGGIQCKCEDCMAVGQFVLETQAIVKAWRQVQPKHPDTGLRILLTQGSWATNEAVLADIPLDIGVTYYSGSKTYDSSRDEMIYPLLEADVARGRWMGCYPQLTASWRIVCPWTGPQFIHYRMNEFVDDGLACLCGYATPDNRAYEFNVLGSAEWSWNAKGRSPREFAAAWATRQGFADPDAVADWALRIGPVGWDLYGSGVPFPQFFGRASNYVKQGAAPTFGEGLYRYFPSLEHLDADIAIAQACAEEAAGWDAPTLRHEAEVIGNMLRMLRAIHDLGVALSDADLALDTQRERLNTGMYVLVVAADGAQTAMRDWRDSIEGWSGSSRLDDTVDVIGKTVSEVGTHLVRFGIEDPGRPFRENAAGTWEQSDFAPEQRVTKTFEVTDLLTVPGTWLTGFRYTAGWHGLTSYSVELLSAPKDAPDDLTSVTIDEHVGVAAHQPRDNEYALEVAEIAPDRRYFLRVDIRGTADANATSGRTGCSGTVWLRKEGAPSLDGPPALKPLTDEQASAFGPPKFASDRPHVGVVTGGYGAAGIHEWLSDRDEVEVRAVPGLAAAMIAPCDVVVLAQPMIGGIVGDDIVAALRAFVAGGGGLVVTHDSVGFREQPAIVPEVCAGGLDKASATEWEVVGDHPVTAGIAAGERHGQSYYDQIVLAPGKDGMVVARSSGADGPIAIAGSHGEGRYVALGLAVGLAPDATDVLPEGAEARLLLNAVTWAAGA